MKLKKILTIVLMVVMVASVLAGCSKPAPPTGGEATEIVIGTLYPMSGGMALLGDESFRGAELARQKWNEEGGILGKQIRFVSADAPDTAAATAEAERLISQERMTVILGSYASPLAMAASEVAERNEIVYFESGGIANPIMERGFEWLFRFVQQASDLGIGGIRAAAAYGPDALGKQVKDIRVAIVFEDGPYGSAVAEWAKKEAELLGFNVVAFESYNAQSIDLSSLIERLKTANPDVLSITSYINDAILFHQQSKELGFYVPIFIGNGGGHAMNDFAAAVGDTVNGVFNVDVAQYALNMDNAPGMADFIERYEKAYGHKPRSGHSVLNYAGAQVLFEAIKLAEGSVEPTKLREGLRAIDIPLFSLANTVGAKFGPNGQNINVHGVAHQWQMVDGEYKQLAVFPAELAVTEPVLPIPKW